MKKYFSIILLATGITSLTGCLKDDKANLTSENSPAVVEFSTATRELATSPSGSTYALYERSYPIAASVDVPFDINYTGGSAAPKDIKVTFGTKPAAIQQYIDERLTNDRQVVALFPLATNAYTLPPVATIPKGQRKVTVIAKVNTSLITDFDKSFIIPLSITDAEGTAISGNYGTILVKVGPKNAYDGVYTASGTIKLPTATRVIARDKTYRTVGLYSVQSGIADIAAEVKLTVDPATNLVSFFGTVNVTGDVIAQPGVASTYDPATKTFHLHYQYAGGGGNRIIDEDLKFKQ